MEALKLFYDFEDEERINGTMLNFCKNDVRILK
jgi:hypothetical protein